MIVLSTGHLDWFNFDKGMLYCSTAVISRYKDSSLLSFQPQSGWLGDIMKQSDGAAWVGELPEFYRSMVIADYLGVDNTSVSASLERIDDEIKALTQDIASYQVHVNFWLRFAAMLKIIYLINARVIISFYYH